MLEFADNVDQFLICSNTVCQKIEAEGGLPPLIDSLKNSKVSESFMEKVLKFFYFSLTSFCKIHLFIEFLKSYPMQTLNILARILDPSKEMKSKVSKIVLTVVHEKLRSSC